MNGLSRKAGESSFDYASRMTSQGVFTRYAIDLMKNGYSLEEIQSIIDETRMSIPPMFEVLDQILAKKGVSVPKIAAWSEVDNTTIYRIMQGTRNPTRNLILRIAINLELSLEDTQTLLKVSNLAQLSGTRPRDLIIMKALLDMDKEEHDEIEQINQKLIDSGMPDLYIKS